MAETQKNILEQELHVLNHIWSSATLSDVGLADTCNHKFVTFKKLIYHQKLWMLLVPFRNAKTFYILNFGNKFTSDQCFLKNIF